jgi:hypothetical protein
MKPFYSRRRLKKMGINVTESKYKINLHLINTSGRLKHAANITKMLKNTKKSIEFTIDTVGSCASFNSNFSMNVELAGIAEENASKNFFKLK